MRQIPSLAGLPRDVVRPLEAIKENIDEVRGNTGNKIAKLPGTASSADIINKINEVLTLLQG